MNFDETIDRLLQYVCPAKVDSKPFRDEQKEELSEICEVLGSQLASKVVIEWMSTNTGSGKTFHDLKNDRRYHSYFKSARLKSSTTQIASVAPAARPSLVDKPLKSKGSRVDSLWELIKKDLTTIPTENISLNQELRALFRDQFPDYKTVEYLMILNYMASSFSIPLIIGVSDFQFGMFLLAEIHRKTNRLTDQLLISPREIDNDMCPNGFWEDFPDWCPDDEQKSLIRLERYNTGHDKLGLFALYASDNVEEYHPEFKRLLRYYVYNYKTLILIDKNLKVASDHWLTVLLRRSITLEVGL